MKMGNHDVGRGMAAAARVFWIANGEAEVTKGKALQVLDAMAEGYLGADAEFDDELHIDSALSKLVCIAFDASDKSRSFLTGNDDEEETGYEEWYETVYRPFRDRYGFC